MPRRIGQQGATGIYDTGTPAQSPMRGFNLSTPAGWVMIWWGISVLIILAMFLSL